MNHPVFQNWIVQKIIFQNYILALSISSMGSNCVRVCFEQFLSDWILYFFKILLKIEISKLNFAFSKIVFLNFTTGFLKLTTLRDGRCLRFFCAQAQGLIAMHETCVCDHIHINIKLKNIQFKLSTYRFRKLFIKWI